MNDAYIIACVRSPITKSGKGALSLTRIDDVAAQVLQALMARAQGIDLSLIEDVIIGCAMPEGEQGLNVARNISLLAGLPVSSAGVTINRFCASSMEAVAQAARAIWCDDGDLFVAGGIESMGHVPMGGFNPSLNEKLMKEGVPDAYISMGLTAENVAKKYSITREEQDHFAFASHMKAVAAQGRGRFDAEIVTIKANAASGESVDVSKDDGPRQDTSIEALAKLAPSFLMDGTVTAGNSSPISDGAAMILIASKRFVKRMKLKPLAKIRAMAVAGVDPSIMGIGPVIAVPKVIKRAKTKLKKIGLIELNEAFAAQSVAVVKELGFDEHRLNVNGGAIAMGHPLGMSGARIITTLVHSMSDRDIELGLATMCIGGGQGMAMIAERA